MIWVFKTSITSKVQVKKVAPILNKIVLPQGKWNFDLEDCDKILRIECLKMGILCEEYIMEQLKASGYYVEVLE